jgi:hypothetical protein
MALVADLFERAQSSTAAAASDDSIRDGRRTRLQVVPRRRRAAGFFAVVVILVVVMMLGAAMLHTELAARQLEIDRLDRALGSEQERFDDLRAQRAVLRSPTRLGEYAISLGMSPMERSEFVSVDPWVMARAIAATSDVPVIVDEQAMSAPLEQFRRVKALGSEAP